MKVSLIEVLGVFDNLISGDISKEDASNWAKQRQKAEDSGNLEYEPTSKEQKIWDAILYLEGVDLKDAPDSYLHTAEDFHDYRNSCLLQN